MAGDIPGGPSSPVLGEVGGLISPGASWLSVGSQILGGLMGGKSSSQQSTSASGPAELNTSGWVVGEGDANGGNLSGGFSLPDLPWWLWGIGGVVALYAIKKRAI